MATDAIWAAADPAALAFATGAFFLGGYVKGAVGFALPLIAVTGAASFLSAETAVAMAILPVLVTNLWQALRQGLAPLLETARRFWLLNLMLVGVLWFSAGLLPGLDDRVFFAILGVMVGSFALIQLIGWNPELSARHERPASVGAGAVAGFFGGLSGIWGPPVVLFLVALRIPKVEQIRATGLAFLCGSLMLAPAHMSTGVLNAESAQLSAAALLPTLVGMWLGQKTQDRLDPVRFRRLTLIVLVAASLNLLRRALF